MLLECVGTKKARLETIKSYRNLNIEFSLKNLLMITPNIDNFQLAINLQYINNIQERI